jgi:hypothetical protein
MTWTKETIKYCLLSFAGWEKQESDSYTSGRIPLSGLFNWSLALNGDRAFPRSRAQVDKYNLVHVNITANNIHLISQLFDIVDRSKTSVMFNVDYAIEMWYPSFKFPSFFIRELDRADYIFAVEDRMAELLSALLKRPVPVIPHPTATHMLSFLQKSGDGARRTEIGVSVHSYETNHLLPALAIRLAELDPKWISTLVGHVQNEIDMAHAYTAVLGHMDFPALMAHVAEMYAVIESYTIHSYGRFTTECAALGVPVIGSDCVSSQRRLFPGLTTQCGNVVKQSRLLRQLINEPAFWTDCASYASKASEYYSFNSCAEQMLAFLNGDH